MLQKYLKKENNNINKKKNNKQLYLKLNKVTGQMGPNVYQRRRWR